MAASGTEAKILNTIARLKVANRREISRVLGISLDYVNYLLNYLRRKGSLIFSKGLYLLPGGRIMKKRVSRKAGVKIKRKKKR